MRALVVSEEFNDKGCNLDRGGDSSARIPMQLKISWNGSVRMYFSMGPRFRSEVIAYTAPTETCRAAPPFRDKYGESCARR